MNTSLQCRAALFVLPLVVLSACGGGDANDAPKGPAAPVAKVVPHAMTEHGQVRNDDYFWMRLSDAQKEADAPDAQTQDVLDYLNAENAYQKAMMAHTDTLQKELFDEIADSLRFGV